MSKSILTRRPSNRQYAAHKEGTRTGEQKEEQWEKHWKGAEKVKGNERVRKVSRELNRSKIKDTTLRRQPVQAPPAVPKSRNLDWCECNPQVNRLCDACSLLGLRRTDLDQQRHRLQRADYIDYNNVGYDSSAYQDYRLQVAQPHAQVQNGATFFNQQSGSSRQPQHDIWNQMQELLATSDEIFPSTSHQYDDDYDTFVGGQMMPDLDDVPLRHKW